MITSSNWNSFSALLDLCAGTLPVTSEFPSQRPVARSFDVFFDLRLNKRLSKKIVRLVIWDVDVIWDRGDINASGSCVRFQTASDWIHPLFRVRVTGTYCNTKATGCERTVTPTGNCSAQLPKHTVQNGHGERQRRENGKCLKSYILLDINWYRESNIIIFSSHFRYNINKIYWYVIM